MLSGRRGIGLVGAVGVALALAGGPAGATALADHRPAAEPSAQPRSVTPASSNSSDPSELVAHDGEVWFLAYTPSTGEAIWSSDGSTSGLKLPVYGNLQNTGALMWAGNHLFFVSENTADSRQELWVADGTGTDTPMSFDVTGPTGYFSDGFFAAGSRIYFNVCDASHGCEPWVSDGSGPGTHLLKDIYPGPGNSDAYEFVALGSGVVFAATDPTHGRELWISDNAGTRLVRDILPGPSSAYPFTLVSVGNRVVFSADDDIHGAEPWVTDGTKAGTRLLKDIAHGTSGSSPLGGGNALFKGKLYFIANDGVHGQELWRTNGTAAGTQLGVDVWHGARSSDPYQLIATSTALFFTAQDANHGDELWRTNGTASGTGLARDLTPGVGSTEIGLYPQEAATLGGELVFAAVVGNHGAELWTSKGTPSSTRILKEIGPGSQSADVNWVTQVGHQIFFEADDGTNGDELWVTDGTGPATYMVKDLYP